MAIKGLAFAALVFSAQLSEAAVLGPRNHWPRLASVSNATTSQEPEPELDTDTDLPTSPVPSFSSDGEDEPPALVTSENGDVCTPVGPGDVITVYSIIYTETLTWSGDPSDYVAPFAELTTPTYCDPEPTTTTTTSSSSTTSTAKWTLVPGLSDGYRTFCLIVNPTSCLREPVFNPSVIYSTKPYIAPIKATSPIITSTFFITSKNPSVVFPPSPTADYGAETDPPPQKPDQGDHQPAETNPPQSVLTPNRPTQVAITADPTKVIIGTRTISDLKPGATTRVTVGGDVYEVNPSKIVQVGGKTINRPGVGQALTVAAPTSTVIDGLSITVSGSTAVIGGYTYEIGPTAGTEIIQGRTVVISPTGISFENTGNGVTYHASLPEQTGIIVAGGEMLTLMGQSVLVIHETTITYGPGISPQTKVVDDDTIVAGSDGVTLHGSTVGGGRLRPSETNYDVVGGATLTRVGPSKMVIGGVTYTVGPGTGTTTTFVGGEDITIAPDGITVATLTIPYPFGPTVETDEDEEDGAPTGMRPSLIVVCIAIGAWALLL
ncbi:uncharacterized protein DNG_08706 [Cephalotrichum gorgonifer]|uniref:Uncharacterized protein n=1 Tax=Cephalotrichum gorgonifer TaxID=2041049 RepID=A0AAE8SZF1_9PEZI|nr:uncharacterized protein DNG_08706 [Cephalotrichum gorgonifer]